MTKERRKKLRKRKKTEEGKEQIRKYVSDQAGAWHHSASFIQSSPIYPVNTGLPLFPLQPPVLTSASVPPSQQPPSSPTPAPCRPLLPPSPRAALPPDLLVHGRLPHRIVSRSQPGETQKKDEEIIYLASIYIR